MALMVKGIGGYSLFMVTISKSILFARYLLGGIVKLNALVYRPRAATKRAKYCL